VPIEIDRFSDDFDPRFKIFHELMAKKIRDVLLVSTPYEAWIMEEDCRLSERIIHEYRGLNLSNPPRLTWVSSAEEALKALDQKQFDMVITMQRLADMDAYSLGQKIKAKAPELPVVLLSHSMLPFHEGIPGRLPLPGIDRTFMWSGDTDILVALIKSAEDKLNVAHDTESAGIRVILVVEDSPAYFSSLLPILYKELVSQAQAVMEEGLNEEHRLLTMRARPKILIAETFEDAVSLYEQFEPYVLGVLSDVRIPKNNKLNDTAGIDLLSEIKEKRWDIPILLMSSEPSNAEIAARIPASFVDKNSTSLLTEIRSFFIDHLGFGDFVFRTPEGQEIGRAANLRSLENLLPTIPDDAFVLHCSQNDFSRWLFARSEIVLASKLRPVRHGDFTGVENHRQFIIDSFHELRKWRQRGVVANFDAKDFDPDTEFFKIGTGSLGGKARGLAFASTMLRRNSEIYKKFPKIDISIPQTLVITTEAFDAFVEMNSLRELAKAEITDEEIAARFLEADFPDWVHDELNAYLSQIRYPLAIRSSSLLEDAQFRAYAGLYRTYMIPNDHPDLQKRLEHLISAVKLVYASTYYQGPKAFSKRIGQRTEEEKMAVVIQRLVGERYGSRFYPAISGVAQSHNYYPFSKMKPEEGIATVALGLGKLVMEGEKALRFSPKYPQLLPQRSTVEDILENSQRFFYSLKLDNDFQPLGINEDSTLEKKEVVEVEKDTPMRLLAGTYVPDEHRIRESTHVQGHRVLTFAPVLKYDLFPLADILSEVLEMGHEGMGCPVELEFSVNLCEEAGGSPEFAVLQLRPMTAREELTEVEISQKEIDSAFCVSPNALGNAVKHGLKDILYVKPDEFDAGSTPDIARQIGMINADLIKEGRKYLLIGPGRWGSADRFLGIPVSWAEISGVGAIVEIASSQLRAEPSQGSHFFHNITSLGINYVTVSENTDNGGSIDWKWLTSLPVTRETRYVSHIQLNDPITLKVDGRKSYCVMTATE